MTKEEIVALFKTKVGSNPSHSELVAHVQRQHEALNYLLSALGQQAKTILEIRDQLVDHKNGIESLANIMGAEPDDGSVISLPDPPQLVGFN